MHSISSFDLVRLVHNDVDSTISCIEFAHLHPVEHAAHWVASVVDGFVFRQDTDACDHGRPVLLHLSLILVDDLPRRSVLLLFFS